MNGHLASAVLARWNKWSVLDRIGLVIVKLYTACDVARMSTLSASQYLKFRHTILKVILQALHTLSRTWQKVSLQKNT